MAVSLLSDRWRLAVHATLALLCCVCLADMPLCRETPGARLGGEEREVEKRLGLWRPAAPAGAFPAGCFPPLSARSRPSRSSSPTAAARGRAKALHCCGVVTKWQSHLDFLNTRSRWGRPPFVLRLIGETPHTAVFAIAATE